MATEYTLSTFVDNGAVGTEPWTGVASCTLLDGASATSSHLFDPTAVPGAIYTHYIKGSIPSGGSIPSNYIIDGIVVTAKSAWAVSPTPHDYSIMLTVGGVLSGDEKATATPYSTTPSNRQWGGATDTWGLTLTGADIPNLGVALSFAFVDDPVAPSGSDGDYSIPAKGGSLTPGGETGPITYYWYLDQVTITIYASAPCIVPSTPTLTGTAGDSSVALVYSYTGAAPSLFYYEQATAAIGPFTACAGSPTSSASFTALGLANGTTYYFRARGSNSCGTSGYSAVISKTPAAAVSAPGAPTITLSAGTCVLNVSWSAVANAASYDLDWSRDGVVWTSLLASTAVTAYVHADVASGVYYYRVRAKNSAGNSGYATANIYNYISCADHVFIALMPVDAEDSVNGRICTRDGLWYAGRGITYVNGRPFAVKNAPRSSDNGNY